jgi:hypothetical protein
MDAWVEGYSIKNPDKRAFIPLNCIQFVQTLGCKALPPSFDSSGQPIESPFEPDEVVVVTESNTGAQYSGYKSSKLEGEIISFPRVLVKTITCKVGSKEGMLSDGEGGVAGGLSKAEALKHNYVFFHLDPANGLLQPFSQEDNVLINAADARKKERVRISDVKLPNGMILNFEVRFGKHATSGRMPKPSSTGYCQVNIANDNTRLVHRFQPSEVGELGRMGKIAGIAAAAEPEPQGGGVTYFAPPPVAPGTLGAPPGSGGGGGGGGGGGPT